METQQDTGRLIPSQNASGMSGCSLMQWSRWEGSAAWPCYSCAFSVSCRQVQNSFTGCNNPCRICL